METMSGKKHQRRRTRKIFLAAAGFCILALLVFTAVYLADYYRADDRALDFLESSGQVNVTVSKKNDCFPASADNG